MTKQETILWFEKRLMGAEKSLEKAIEHHDVQGQIGLKNKIHAFKTALRLLKGEKVSNEKGEKSVRLL